MTHLLRQDAGDYNRALRFLMGFWLDIYLGSGWPVIGYRSEGDIEAAAIVTPPSAESDPDLMTALTRRFACEVGTEAVSRLERFESECEEYLPDSPHYFLGILAVRPKSQRSGIGRMLLDEVHRLSETDERSSGVCLTTEIQENVGYYSGHGYSVLEKKVIDGVSSWCMFREAAPS